MSARAAICLVGALVGLVWPRAASAQSEPSTEPAADTGAPAEEPASTALESVAVPAEPSSPALRVAVLLLPTGDVDPATTDALTELLIAAVAARGSPQILGKEELLALLGRDDASMLECMASPTCLGIAGVELGLTEIVSGTLGQRDGAWIFVLDRIDVRSGDTAARVFRVVEGGLDALIAALSDATDELYVETVRPGRIVLHAAVAGVVELDGAELGETIPGTPFRHDLIPPGTHELVLRARGHAPWVRTIEVEEGASLVLDAVPAPVSSSFEVPALTWVLGGASLLALGGGIALGISSQATVTPDATMREVFEFFDAREREAIAADVLYGLAGAFAVGAIVPLAFALAGDDDPALALLPRFTFGPAPAAELTVRGQF